MKFKYNIFQFKLLLYPFKVIKYKIAHYLIYYKRNIIMVKTYHNVQGEAKNEITQPYIASFLTFSNLYVAIKA